MQLMQVMKVSKLIKGERLTKVESSTRDGKEKAIKGKEKEDLTLFGKRKICC